VRGKRGGFTLVEVIIVLAIMGIIGAVTAPSLARLGRQDELTASAGEVARVLRSARMAALERAVPVSVIIEPAARKYLVKTETDDGQLTLAEGTMPLPPGVTLTSERPRVRFAFTRLGSASPDSLTVTGDGGAAVVGVKRWSGEVYVRADGRTGGRMDGRTGGRANGGTDG
jgi:type II secretion system protein H